MANGLLVHIETLKQLLHVFSRYDLDAIMEFFPEDPSMDLSPAARLIF